MSDSEKPTRDKILDAADRCFRRYSVAKTTIDDIAEEAGVSRATVYRYVGGGRDEILIAVLLAEARRQFLPMVEKSRHLDTFAERITAMGTEAVLIIRADDRLSMLFTPEVIGIGSSQPESATAMVTQTLEILAPILDDARAAGELRQDVTDREAAEWLLRNVLSLLTFSGTAGSSRDSIERIMQTFVVPPLRPMPK